MQLLERWFAPRVALPPLPERIEPRVPAIENSAYKLSDREAMAEIFQIGSSPAGVAVTETTAMRIATAYACTRLIAGAIASLPLHIYQRTDTGPARIEHDLWWRFNEQPTPAFSAATFWEYLVKCQLLRGDGFAYLARDRNGKVLEVLPLRPESVRPVARAGRIVYDTELDGKIRGIDQDDMLHFAGFGFDGLKSLSVIKHAAYHALGIALAADEYSAAFFANGTTSKHVLKTTQGKLSEEQIQSIRQQWAEHHAGAQNAGKPMVLFGGLDVATVSLSAEDAQLLESRRFQVTDICRAFGVPPHMVGETEKTSSWGSGIEHQSIGFVTYTLTPHLIRIKQELNRKLFRTSKFFFEHSVDGLLRGDAKTRADYYRQGMGGSQGPGWMTPNEIRRLENLPPIDGGNERFTQTSTSTGAGNGNEPTRTADPGQPEPPGRPAPPGPAHQDPVRD